MSEKGTLAEMASWDAPGALVTLMLVNLPTHPVECAKLTNSDGWALWNAVCKKKHVPQLCRSCRQAIGFLVKSGQWHESSNLLMRFAASCDAAGARSSQCKAYLGAVVVWLHAGDAKQAWMTYQVSRRGFYILVFNFY